MDENDLNAIEIREIAEELHRVAGAPPRETMHDTGWIDPRMKIDLLIKSAFTPKEWHPQRFTQQNGETAFYAALEWKTACEEVAYHFPKRWGYMPSVKNGAPIRYLHFLCNFKGKIKDICVLADRFPDLQADGHNNTCAVVARHARTSGADALVSPSVRNRPNGRCVTVFTHESLSPTRIEQDVLFSLTPDTGSVKYSFQPYRENPVEW